MSPGAVRGDRIHSWFGIAATALVPILVVALVLSADIVVLLALVVDVSVALRYGAGVWLTRRSRTR
jgi:hypothetical protein